MPKKFKIETQYYFDDHQYDGFGVMLFLFAFGLAGTGLWGAFSGMVLELNNLALALSCTCTFFVGIFLMVYFSAEKVHLKTVRKIVKKKTVRVKQ